MRDDDLAVGDAFPERELKRMIVKLSFVRLIQFTLKQQVWLRQAQYITNRSSTLTIFFAAAFGLLVFASWRSYQERNESKI
jgi:hypothetical protein